MVQKGPIFIVGCGRSGTTLLRLMLASHPDVAISFESNFMIELMRHRARVLRPMDITTDEGWRKMLGFIINHPSVGLWGLDKARLQESLARIPERTYAGAFTAVFVEFMRQQGKQQWGDKTPQHVQYMLVLKKLFPQARFIHIIRDGRDVALSLVSLRVRPNPWGPRYMCLSGYYWAWLVLSGLISGVLLGPESYREVRFEDLVLEPEKVLRSLCTWAGLPFHTALLDYYRNRTTREFASVGPTSRRRLGQPPDKRRVLRWKQDMKPDGRRSILRQAGGLLAHLGYEVDFLSASQRRIQSTLSKLMDSTQIESLAWDFPVPGDKDLQVKWSLLLDHVLQLVSLPAGRVETFGRCSIRWQRSVGSRMG